MDKNFWLVGLITIVIFGALFMFVVVVTVQRVMFGSMRNYHYREIHEEYENRQVNATKHEDWCPWH